MSPQKRIPKKKVVKPTSRPKKKAVSKGRRRASSPAPTVQKALERTHRMCTSTMEICVEPTADDICSRSASFLDITCPNQEPLRIPLEDSDIFIGRDDICQIHLPLTNVSRRHARITGRQDDFAVEDLDSTNGTFINGVRVSRCVLRNNDQIRIGDARIHFVQHRVRG